MNKINSVTVFCGSSFGDTQVFKETAAELGKYIARKKIKLVYGGGSVGLMGEVALNCLNSGGSVCGIIPERIHSMIKNHFELTETIVVEDMHKRKSMMYEKSDAFIALPGGIGTIEELFEVFTWLQLGYHNKPVSILNIDSYYDKLLEFMDSMVDRCFLKTDHRNQLIVSDSFEELFEKMASVDITYKQKL